MLGPEVLVTARIDQPRIHPDPVVRALHTAFHDMGHTQRLRDFAADCVPGRFCTASRCAADDFQIGNLGEISENFVLHAFGKICVFFVPAEIFKRQHGDAFLGW